MGPSLYSPPSPHFLFSGSHREGFQRAVYFLFLYAPSIPLLSLFLSLSCELSKFPVHLRLLRAAAASCAPSPHCTGRSAPSRPLLSLSLSLSLPCVDLSGSMSPPISDLAIPQIPLSGFQIPQYPPDPIVRLSNPAISAVVLYANPRDRAATVTHAGRF